MRNDWSHFSRLMSTIGSIKSLWIDQFHLQRHHLQDNRNHRYLAKDRPFLNYFSNRKCLVHWPQDFLENDKQSTEISKRFQWKCLRVLNIICLTLTTDGEILTEALNWHWINLKLFIIEKKNGIKNIHEHEQYRIILPCCAKHKEDYFP